MSFRSAFLTCLCLAGVIYLVPACTSEESSKQPVQPTQTAQPGQAPQPLPVVANPTYSRDVAPILLANCASCHRPGQSAPFSLLTYQDAKRRARQIAQVTQSRFMPPWLPQPGYGEFAQTRRLSDAEIETLQRWHRDGAPEGDPAELPPTPEWTDGWQLGEPDLIVQMPASYELVAEGADVFRNFVLPTSLRQTRYVQGVEFRPLNPRAVHHSVLYVDETQSSRHLDAEDDEPGYGGMFGRGNARTPPGQLLGWTPGKVPLLEPESRAWPLAPGTDLVLQLHMVPTGRPEQVGFEIGLHFSPQPPTEQATILRLGSRTIDIPAGAARYLVQEEMTLPVATQVLGVYPHAHYLGKTMTAYATLPNGERQWLLNIVDWDFNWQDSYRYRSPISLPAGTRLHMEFTFDNSEDNVRNPHVPPQRVRYGPDSTDEMGDLWLQVLAPGRQETARLARVISDYETRDRLAQVEKEYRDFPEQAVAIHNKAVLLRDAGNVPRALELFQEAVARDPNFAEGHYNLAKALASLGRLDEALDSYRHAVRAQPKFVDARNNLGVALAARRQYASAIAQYRAALEVAPDYAVVVINLALAQRGMGERDSAIATLRGLLERRPQELVAQIHLADTYYLNRQPDLAIAQYQKVIAREPRNADARNGIASCYLWKQDFDQAIEQFQAAIQLRPGFAAAHRNLARALDKKGLPNEAARHRARAAEIDSQR